MVTSVLLLLSCLVHPSKIDPFVEDRLRGSKGFCISVESLGPQAAGVITQSDIRNTVELELAKAGIPEYSDKEDAEQDFGSAKPILTLYINLNVLNTEHGVAFSLSTYAYQFVQKPGEEQSYYLMELHYWDSGTLGVAPLIGASQYLSSTIERQLKPLEVAWLKANKKNFK